MSPPSSGDLRCKYAMPVSSSRLNQVGTVTGTGCRFALAGVSSLGAGYLLTSLTARVRPGSVEVSGGTLGSWLPATSVAWLSSGLRPRRAPCGEWLQRGLLGSK